MTKITSRPFGTVHGKQAILYTLDNGIISADITDYGAALTALRTVSRSGETLDVLLGYESAEQYSLQDGYLGATVGRCCNRIAGGSFWLGGTTYCLYQNDGKSFNRRGFSDRSLLFGKDHFFSQTLHSASHLRQDSASHRAG